MDLFLSKVWQVQYDCTDCSDAETIDLGYYFPANKVFRFLVKASVVAKKLLFLTSKYQSIQ